MTCRKPDLHEQPCTFCDRVGVQTLPRMSTTQWLAPEQQAKAVREAKPIGPLGTPGFDANQFQAGDHRVFAAAARADTCTRCGLEIAEDNSGHATGCQFEGVGL